MPFQDIPSDPSLADPLPNEPFGIVGRWFTEAEQRADRRNPLAMSVATVDAEGRPSARMVLCRGFERDPGFIVFYTNWESSKGRELAAHPYAAAVFHWDSAQRQIRIQGPVVVSPDIESEAYFSNRPRPAQIAAWASDQSQPIASRTALLDRLAQFEEKFGTGSGPPIPRPSNWGGYRIFCESVELWVGAEGRAHDRGLWTRTLTRSGDGYTGVEWTVTRLQP